jgi:hypothetical protein
VKSELAFDPRDHDYGPATKSVRSLLTKWGDIDWFEPTATSDGEVVSIFREHNKRVHAASPELVAEHVEISVVHGQWPQFEAWCKRVREQQSGCWKYGVLKQVSHQHMNALGWSFETWARSMPEPTRLGDLVHRYRDAGGTDLVMWGNVYPRVAADGESSGFYLGYAHGDLLDAIRWQLAERHNDRSRNPFDALVRCYHAGAYPFVLDRSTVVLFRWSPSGAEP